MITRMMIQNIEEAAEDYIKDLALEKDWSTAQVVEHMVEMHRKGREIAGKGNLSMGEFLTLMGLE